MHGWPGATTEIFRYWRARDVYDAVTKRLFLTIPFFATPSRSRRIRHAVAGEFIRSAVEPPDLGEVTTHRNECCAIRRDTDGANGLTHRMAEREKDAAGFRIEEADRIRRPRGGNDPGLFRDGDTDGSMEAGILGTAVTDTPEFPSASDLIAVETVIVARNHGITITSKGDNARSLGNRDRRNFLFTGAIHHVNPPQGITPTLFPAPGKEPAAPAEGHRGHPAP